MRISEIFHSIQGEGLLLGVPSVFVRTSGCNLRCRWCDTPYASWHPEGEQMSISEILARVQAFHCNHVVLTGGEPMIAPGIHELAASLRASGHHLTIETAGTIEPAGIACDLASLSPKLANSTPDREQAGPWLDRHEVTRLQPEVIRRWLASYSAQLKFVISTGEELTEIQHLLAEIGTVPNFNKDRILLMPEGIDLETLKSRESLLTQLCLEHGFRYAPRLQIQLFGNTRGT